MDTIEVNPDFPSDSYTRYRSQARTNPLLNKLHQDAGYPQDTLLSAHHPAPAPHKNYLLLNKQNLKNFFAERLPPRDVCIMKESFTIDPARLFQMKKQQHERRTITRTVVEHRVSSRLSSDSGKDKISTIFELNDKNEDFKKKFATAGPRSATHYDTSNFRKGTQSFVQKYSRITKKEAYNSVFGPEQSAIVLKDSRMNRTLMARPYTNGQAPKNSKTLKDTKKYREDEADRKKFSSLIQRIDKHRLSFDPDNRCGSKAYSPLNNVEDNEDAKDEVIGWIRATAQNFKNKMLDSCFSVKQMEDLQKIDGQFYLNMRNHKAKRLHNRESIVSRSLISKTRAASRSEPAAEGINKEPNRKGTDAVSQNLDSEEDSISVESAVEASMEVADALVGAQSPANYYNPLYLLKKMGRVLVNALLQARFYGIKNNLNIYKAFWKQTTPYEKSGSYAFFNAIKKRDVQGVSKFITADYEYVYEKDEKGRSPLIVAVIKGSEEIVNMIMSYDINVNQRCYKQKTALYFAIRSQNVRLAKKLLQTGAIPWSNSNCRYSHMLAGCKNRQLDNLMKNARKIAISVQLQPTKPQKVQLWNTLKGLIDENFISQLQ